MGKTLGTTNCGVCGDTGFFVEADLKTMQSQTHRCVCRKNTDLDEDVMVHITKEQSEKRESRPLDTQVGGNHYKDMAIQPIEFILANKLPYCEANIIKYACRHKRKNGAEDIRKVIQYAMFILENDYGEKA